MSAVKAFFSGIESDQHFNACVNAGVVHVLTSFLYLEKKGDMDIVKKRKKKYPHLQFMIDSGAHTFQTDFDKFKHWTKADFDNYVARYAKWLLANKEYIFCAVEFDIDYVLNQLFGGGGASTVGSSMVAKWQKTVFQPLQEKGVDICYVWHPERKLEGWEEMCSQFSYCGLPGEMSKDADFNKYMSVARRYNTKVHGFAATKQTDFRDWPWYSVDSITWKTCEMYGTLIHWDSHKQLLIFDQDKSRRALYRADFERLGLDADGIIKDTNYKEVTKYALHSMRAMEDFYEHKYANRLMYYDLRLPHPRQVLRGMTNKLVLTFWQRFRPPTLFKDHAAESRIDKLRMFLATLACLQYKDYTTLKTIQGGEDFLKVYFPRLVNPMADEIVFQKELASYLAPSAPPALRRVDAEHFVATNNAPKKREPLGVTLADLEWEVPSTLPLLED